MMELLNTEQFFHWELIKIKIRIDINIHPVHNFRYQNSTYEGRRYPLNTKSDLPKVRTNT